MKVIKRYIVNVYEDFSIETEQIPIENKIGELSLNSIIKASGSLRIKQVLFVISCIKKNVNPHQTIEDKVSSAIKTAAVAFDITSSSVVDKVTRQMDWDMKNFSKTVENFIINGDNKLKEHLLTKVGKHTQNEDRLLIDSVLI